MNLKRVSGGTLGLLAVGALAWGCSGKSDDCGANKSCNPYDGGAAGTSGASGTSGSGSGGASGRGGANGHGGASGRAGASGDAGTNGDSGAAGAASTCDGTLSPDADGCVIGDEYGLFVAPTGNDATGDGTEAKPFATLTKALASVDTIKRIYVCADDYTEPGTLEIPAGVSVFGGFDCSTATWTYDATTKSNFLPTSPIGADVKNADGVTLQDLSITAEDATSPGASSFGLMVVGSDGVTLTRVEIKAGKGGAGMAGGKGDDGLPGTASGAAQNGKPGTCTAPPTSLSGGAAVPAKCVSEGGRGGTGYVATATNPDQHGVDGSPMVSANGGPGGMSVGSAGTPGAFGLDGADGTLPLATDALGTFSAAGYVVASGSTGMPGKPGQGGGGGGASFVTSTCVGSSGGAGGMGGCGGQPGAGGTGGGASVALLSWGSTMTLDSCTLTAVVGGGGGNGGAAGLGGLGQSGGLGGAPSPPISDVKNGGKGGDGGNGGDGGSGSGGTGGPSIALVYDGTEPVQTKTKLIVPAKGGAAGQGGHPGADQKRWAPDGQIGLAQDVYPKPAAL